MAEEGGFEPPMGVNPCRISSAVQSTTLPLLRGSPCPFIPCVVAQRLCVLTYFNTLRAARLGRLAWCKNPAALAICGFIKQGLAVGNRGVEPGNQPFLRLCIDKFLLFRGLDVKRVDGP